MKGKRVRIGCAAASLLMGISGTYAYYRSSDVFGHADSLLIVGALLSARSIQAGRSAIFCNAN